MAVRIDRDADDAAGHVAHEFLAGREERRVRPAESQRHAEALRVAEYAIGAGFAG